eukprot:808561-Rhodomonas_salina.1
MSGTRIAYGGMCLCVCHVTVHPFHEMHPRARSTGLLAHVLALVGKAGRRRHGTSMMWRMVHFGVVVFMRLGKGWMMGVEEDVAVCRMPVAARGRACL